ncbi:hypothetical protein B0H17DRAFT_1201318 [Mycena rosella]|uniref:Uncharacterized protein n=1 Tax=Mycena rosella TaxID=1033263 RepID=A0AAD7DGV2_MYCRO|nr:hypothetical protein B0H17DRAFT_1201318 [Mycena rosella]
MSSPGSEAGAATISSLNSEPADAGDRSPYDREASEAVLKSLIYHMLVEERRMPPKELGIPLKEMFPEDWNFHFEISLSRKYGPDADIEAWKKENVDVGVLAYFGDLPLCNQHIVERSKALLEAEGELVAMAIEQLVDNDFEVAWAALDVDTKKELVLDGLVRAAYKSREESRHDCPETKVLSLVGDGEYNLINLLKEIVAHDPTGNLRVKSLYLFPHPAVEHEYSRFTREYPNSGALEDLRAFEYLRIVQRNLYIVQTLIGILEAYTGKPAPKISLNDERKRSQQGGGAIRAARRRLRTVGRSAECQQRDWRDHKKTPASFIGCPAPDAGFMRSPALWRQIWYLSEKDSYPRDYHFDTTPGNTRSVRIQDPVLRLMFLIARRRAMASGDRGAVGKMHDVLVRQQRAGVFDVTLLQIRGQLEREYREMMEELEYSGRRDRLAEAEWNRQRGAPDDKLEEEEEGGQCDPADGFEELENEGDGVPATDEDEDEDEDEATA